MQLTRTDQFNPNRHSPSERAASRTRVVRAKDNLELSHFCRYSKPFGVRDTQGHFARDADSYFSREFQFEPATCSLDG